MSRGAEILGNLSQLKRKVQDQKVKKTPGSTNLSEGIGIARKRTPIVLKSNEAINLASTIEEPLKKDVAAKIPVTVNKGVLPDRGYYLISKNEPDKLEALRQAILTHGICSLDFETDADIDDETIDTQDHNITMVSFAFKVGLAFCLPIAMDSYGANWDINWIVANFMKPIMENPDVLLVIHNVKAEHGWSLLYGIDMFEKAYSGKVMDTMVMVKALALPQNTVLVGDKYEVQVGLKPATKALLADENGMVHGLIHVDDIKSFAETVGKFTWEEPTGEYYKSGANKGKPKTKKFTRSRRFNELPVDQRIIDYSCSDSDWALGIYYKLIDLLHSEGMYEVVTEIDIPRMMVLAEYELAGWKIDPNRLLEMGRKADKALAEIEPKLQAALIQIVEYQAEVNDDGSVIVPAGAYPMGKWRGEQVNLTIKEAKPFSWGSTQHLQWLFFHILKVDMTGMDRSKKTGLPATGTDSIDAIIKKYTANGQDNEFMKLLNEKRKYDKINSTYVGKYDEGSGKYVGGMLQYCRDDTHKLHTVLNLVSTWRLASKKPNLQNCFDKETRILTRSGWKYFWELKKGIDEVAQYDKDSGKITFVKPVQYIEHPASKLVHLTNQHIDLMVTEDHRCLLRNRRSGNWKVFAAKDYRSDMHQYHAGHYKFGVQELDKNFIDLLCMVQADGYYHDGGIAFAWTKQRKIDRFLNVMEALNIAYTEHKPRGDGQRRFRVLENFVVREVKHYIGEDKIFGDWLIALTKPCIQHFLACIYFWDGCFTRDNHYSSNNRANAEWVQILHTLTGTRANVRIYQGSINLNYQVDKTNRKYSGTANIAKESVEYNDTVYCVTVPKSYVVVERNGKVAITGNCPRADNDPMGIREVFVAPTYDPKKDYSNLRSPLTRPTIYINTGKLSGETVWVGADYSQIELKVLAWYAGEKSMIDTLANGGDLHSKAAHDVFKLNCTLDEVKKLYKPFRYRAKKVNFGLVYGMTEYGLSADPEMNMTTPEAKAFIEQYMHTYPGVRGYQHELIAFARKYGYVETMFNHRRPIPEINDPNKWMRQKGENKAMNSPIQGSAADIIAQAMVNIRREAPKWLKPVIQIHDELMCETPVEYAVEGCKILQSIMERPIEGFSEIMPLVAEPSVGKVWRFALDIKYDEHGTPYVKPKDKRSEATDVTYDDIKDEMKLYKLAGIEVR